MLVALEHPGAVLHVVDPASDGQVRATREKGLGSNNDLEDHSGMAIKCLDRHRLSSAT